eukprot:PhM_4_TR9333/c0_g1_i1/m.76976
MGQQHTTLRKSPLVSGRKAGRKVNILPPRLTVGYESDDISSEISDADSHSSDDMDPQARRDLLLTRAIVGQQLQKLWRGSAWLGSVRFDGDSAVIPLDIKIDRLVQSGNTFGGTRMIGQNRHVARVHFKMYFPRRTTAQIMVAITDTPQTSHDSATGGHFRLAGEHMSGNGMRLTGRCVFGGRSGTFELIRDHLCNDERTVEQPVNTATQRTVTPSPETAGDSQADDDEDDELHAVCHYGDSEPFGASSSNDCIVDFDKTH